MTQILMVYCADGKTLADISDPAHPKCSGPADPETKTTATVSTDTICDHWCGKWETKEKALNSIFSLYRRKTGKILRWYTNWEGYLEWFEVGEREGIEYFYSNEKPIRKFQVTSDATNIINQMTGTYGEGDNKGKVTVENAESRTTFGLCIDDSIQDICMDEAEMTAYLEHLLNIRSIPIYSVSVELPGFYLIETGKQIVFPDDVKYGNIIWSVVDWNFDDAENGPTTYLELTTDETVISPPNAFEIIRSVAQKEVEEALPEAAIVIAKMGDTHLLVEKESDGSRSIVRNLGTNY